MSKSRRLLVLGHLLVLASSCAERAPPVHVASRALVGPAPLVFGPELPRAEGAAASNPYAPIRSGKGRHFSWQRGARSACASTPSAAASAPPIADEAAGFRGSSVAFPGAAGGVAGAKRSDTQKAWGHDEPLTLAPSAPTPDLVVAMLRPRFHHCFSRWLDGKADAEGSVRFALDLGCSGTVQAISAEVQGVDTPTLECLFSVVGPARFAPPTDGHATILVPVVLKNASR